MHRQFWEAGYRIFGLYGVDAAGNCKCGNSKCSLKARYKHPIAANWQHTPVWSEDQMDTMEELGHFVTGSGVLCDGLIVIDIDARNGGVSSYALLIADYPEIAAAGLIVETGSGGGSKHLYFKASPDLALAGKLEKYPGIDFKSGRSFVVAPGSMHISGRKYTVLSGSPHEIDDAPPALLEALKKPEFHRAEIDGRSVDVTYQDLSDMLRYVANNDVDYDTWIKIGMALHHASGGSAFDLWDAWSQTSSKYNEHDMLYKWNSFGRSANPVTLGTLVYYAEQGGWTAPVTFLPDPELLFEDDEPTSISIDGIDLRRPPGFVGEIAAWIEDQCFRSRETLAAAAAIAAIGNISGLRYTDDLTSVTTNLFVFAVGDSGTGKEAVQEAVKTIHTVAGIQAATHGALKSEQEITRNLVRHQACHYLVDEVGITLRKIKNAQTRGGAPYLDGMIGIMMSAYSKGNGTFLLSGDMKEDVRAMLEKELTKIERRMENGEVSPYLQKQHDTTVQQLSGLDRGLSRPFLSFLGFTTLSTFTEIIDYENAANGFIGRSIIAKENESAPRHKKRFRPREMSDGMRMTIMAISCGGEFDLTEASGRVEYYRDKIKIPSTKGAEDMLELCADLFDDMAADHKALTGLEALALRGAEMVRKISLILAIPEGLRNEEHVRWAYAMVRNDIDTKMRLVTANDRIKDNPGMALKSRIADLISDRDGETIGVICNRARAFRREDVERCLEIMVKDGSAEVLQSKHRRNGTLTLRYRLTKRHK